MAGRHAINLTLIIDLFKNDNNNLKRGENALQSGHIESFAFHTYSYPIIKAKVWASMRKKTYNVEVYLGSECDSVQSHSCSCPRGVATCHHLAAVLLYAHYNLSSTDVNCQWNKPSTSSIKEEPLQTIEKLFKAQEYVAVKSCISDKAVEEFRKQLGPNNIVGFSWLLKPEVPDTFLNIVPNIEEVLYSKEYLMADDKINYLENKFKISSTTIMNIVHKTVGQHENELWLMVRRNRLTSSKFGIVLKAIKRGKYPPSLFKSLVEGYTLDRVKAIQWGKENEKTAIFTLEKKIGMPIEATGLWIEESGVLGASPDGLIGDNIVVEVKCPWKFRNTSLKEGVADKKYFFYYEDGEAIINNNHNYYHQIQGQLYFTKKQWCYFFIWTPVENILLKIKKDDNWGIGRAHV